ncbi:ethylene-responsive transcription factor RAP2-1-like [Cocos nucifera]|uniref:Ethylene-responsive transcription factor RAP2-1-like n=1 Tax=Cocos nucifera TaxID=13894 RepID=A0A8K0N1W4_COCNU|nr:ethylene-responsive transcription factor RAP2-1-like [Cocos nucifera]
MRKLGKWVAEVRLPRSREKLWLGSYATAEKAARACDAATYCLKGPGAALNFPDHPPSISSADKLSGPEIRAAARKHARDGRKRTDQARQGEESEVEREAATVDPEEGSSGLRAMEEVSQVSLPEFCFMAEGRGCDVQPGVGVDDDYDDIYTCSPLWNF